MIGVGCVLPSCGAFCVGSVLAFSNGSRAREVPACSARKLATAPRSMKMEAFGSSELEAVIEARESIGMEAAFLSVGRAAN